jgi:hypothetical protein
MTRGGGGDVGGRFAITLGASEKGANRWRCGEQHPGAEPVITTTTEAVVLSGSAAAGDGCREDRFRGKEGLGMPEWSFPRFGSWLPQT